MIQRNTTITISTKALAHNLGVVRAYAPKSKVLAMVKANAYGHGIAQAILGFSDADALGVACMQEATRVRQLGWKRDICLIEGVFSAQEWEIATSTPMNCMCVIHHQSQIDWALASVKTEQTLWLKVNTGMNRLGMTPQAAMQAYEQLAKTGYNIVVTQHFANADHANHPLNQQQINKFNDLVNALTAKHGTVSTSMCNSAGIVNFPKHHHEWVRPGIMLYGANPSTPPTVITPNLQPAMTFTAQVIALHHLQQGEYIGYGSLWQAPTNCNVAVISCGYGDGYPRVVENASVMVNGIVCPIVGRVSMDMITIDVTHLSDIQLNDEVELWGNKIPIDDVAKAANTISYELFCRLTNRPKIQVTESIVESENHAHLP